MTPRSKASVFRRLFAYAVIYKGLISLSLFILLAATGAQLAGPYIAKLIIDRHLAGGDRDFGAVLRLLGIYVALLLAGSALTYIQSYLLQSTALRIIQRMRNDLMERIQRMPIRYFDSTPIGLVVTRIANDTEAIKELFISFMATFAVSGVTLLGVFIALFILDARLAAFTLIMLPLFYVIMLVHLKFSKVYITIMRARLSDMNAKLNEWIIVMPIIQAFRRETQTAAEFDALNEDRYRNQVKQFRVFSLSSRNIVGLIGSLLTALVIWRFGSESLHTAISFGVFYAYIDYLSRIVQPVIGIFDQLLNAQRAVVSADRVFELMDQPVEITEEPGPTDAVDNNREAGQKAASSVPAEAETGAGARQGVSPAGDHSAAAARTGRFALRRPEGYVKFDHVSFAYNEEQYVLKDISLEAKKGETVALVGHTGSGKSSIMNLLLGFYEPNEGTITIDGRDITTVPKQTLRKHMGIVLQDPFLFAGDIKFNVSLYEASIDLDRVKQALREVGAAPFVERLPGGYHEPVVERGSTLSAGQRQLISFARALAFDPAILILDEATASIDSETESLIQNALKVVSAGRTTFIIAHRLSTIKEADQILVLHRGEIVERGNHQELMALQGRYYRMYQLQVGG